jgi:hypothetical protein
MSVDEERALRDSADQRLNEKAFQHWEQTVRDLRIEVQELKSRIEKLESMHEDWRPRPVATGFAQQLHFPEASTGMITSDERPTRKQRHKGKGRWF